VNEVRRDLNESRGYATADLGAGLRRGFPLFSMSFAFCANPIIEGVSRCAAALQINVISAQSEFHPAWGLILAATDCFFCGEALTLVLAIQFSFSTTRSILSVRESGLATGECGIVEKRVVLVRGRASKTKSFAGGESALVAEELDISGLRLKRHDFRVPARSGRTCSTMSGLASVVRSPVSMRLEMAARTRRQICRSGSWAYPERCGMRLGRAILPIMVSMV